MAAIGHNTNSRPRRRSTESYGYRYSAAPGHPTKIIRYYCLYFQVPPESDIRHVKD